MVYVLEFFVVGPSGERSRLDDLKCPVRTVEQARTVGRNVKVRDRQPQLCIIKDQNGIVFTEVGLRAA